MRALDEKLEGKLCDGMQGIIKEGNAMIEETAAGAVLDACISAGAQRAEHYEIGACIAWARAMGHRDVVRLLTQTLKEEKAADKKLSAIAESGVNEAADWGMDDEEANAG